MLQHAKGTAYDLGPDICHALGIETFRRELVEILFKHGQPRASQLFVVVVILLQVAFVRHQLANRVQC